MFTDTFVNSVRSCLFVFSSPNLRVAEVFVRATTRVHDDAERSFVGKSGEHPTLEP